MRKSQEFQSFGYVDKCGDNWGKPVGNRGKPMKKNCNIYLRKMKIVKTYLTAAPEGMFF